MARRALPLGIQTFRVMRERNCYYADKTSFAHRLATEGRHYFLSRPRRFGKSLFLDMLKELFEGSEELFKGLYIHECWDWSVVHPVVRLDFGGGDYAQADWETEDLLPQIEAMEEASGIAPRHASARARLRHLIAKLHEQSGRRVVVLVDEYDKPILDTLAQPDVAAANRRFLRGLYSVLKPSDAHIEFTFFTGVTKFSKVSIFSDLNHLTDITLHPRYASICGYTDEDLDTVFAPEMAGVDREAVREWYDGYRWLGEQRVYNPYGMLLFFDTKRFKAHWFESSTPAFLVDELLRRGIASADLESMAATEDLLMSFDIEEVATEALLFQTGYLTILSEEDRGETVYRLGCPNREVRQGLHGRLLRTLLPETARRVAADAPLRQLLAARDWRGLQARFHSLFASIPYQWHTKNPMGRFEGYYASVFYSAFAAQGLSPAVEESVAGGRLDMALSVDGQVTVFEFKVVAERPEGKALAQLKEKRYAEKYRRIGEPIHLVGVEFSRAERNVVGFEVEAG